MAKKADTVDEQDYSVPQEQDTDGEITPVEQQEPLPTASIVLPEKASPAASFRRGEIVPVDSGRMWVEVRRLSLMSLVRSGRIPDPLMTAAIRIVEQEDTKPPEKEEEETEEDFRKATQDHYAAIDAMVIAVVKDPVLVMSLEEEEANPDVVWVGRIPEVDRRNLLVASYVEIGNLNSFRNQYARADVGQDGAEIRAAS